MADYGRQGQTALRNGHVGINLLYNTKQVLSAPPGDGQEEGSCGKILKEGINFGRAQGPLVCVE